MHVHNKIVAWASYWYNKSIQASNPLCINEFLIKFDTIKSGCIIYEGPNDCTIDVKKSLTCLRNTRFF